MRSIILMCMVLGLVGCASTSSLKKEIEARKQLEAKVIEVEKNAVIFVKRILSKGQKQLIAEMKKEVYSGINERMTADRKAIKVVLGGIDVKFEEYRKIIAEVISERISLLRGDVGREVERALTNGDFIKMLEERAATKAVAKSKERVDMQRGDFIKACVESALDEIIIKQIGVKESDVKFVK